MSKADYYETLGVSRGADDKGIEKCLPQKGHAVSP